MDFALQMSMLFGVVGFFCSIVLLLALYQARKKMAEKFELVNL